MIRSLDDTYFSKIYYYIDNEGSIRRKCDGFKVGYTTNFKTCRENVGEVRTITKPLDKDRKPQAIISGWVS